MDEVIYGAIADIEVRREAYHLASAIDQLINAPVARDETAVMVALAQHFLSSCRMADVDPVTCFAQIVDAIEIGATSMHDDPAKCGWVFPETTTEH
jgi:hypothetical protein